MKIFSLSIWKTLERAVRERKEVRCRQIMDEVQYNAFRLIHGEVCFHLTQL